MIESAASTSDSVKDLLGLISDVSPEAAELASEARNATDQLAQRLDKAEGTLAEIREALNVYATEKGDPMFLQEFELARSMVRGRKK